MKPIADKRRYRLRTALAVRPGKRFEIVSHFWPRMKTLLRMMASSSAVHRSPRLRSVVSDMTASASVKVRGDCGARTRRAGHGEELWVGRIGRGVGE